MISRECGDLPSGSPLNLYSNLYSAPQVLEAKARVTVVRMSATHRAAEDSFHCEYITSYEEMRVCVTKCAGAGFPRPPKC